MASTAPQRSRGGSNAQRGRGRSQGSGPSSSLSSAERHQFDLVAEFKPEWKSEQVIQFCKDYDWNGDRIQTAMASLFEFDRPAHADEEWQTIPERKKDDPPALPANGATRGGRGSRGGRGGSTRGGISDRSTAAQSALTDSNKPRGEWSGRGGRGGRGGSTASPRGADGADGEESAESKKKFGKKNEKPAAPAVPQVQLPVAGKSYAASLGLNKTAASTPAAVAPTTSKSNGADNKEARSAQKQPTSSSPAPAATALPSSAQSPESAVPTQPVVPPVKTAAQIVAAGPKKPQPKQAPAPASAAAPAPVQTEQKTEEPKSNEASPSAASPAPSVAKPQKQSKWRKKESTSASPLSTAAPGAASPPPVTETVPAATESSGTFPTLPHTVFPATSAASTFAATPAPSQPAITQPLSPQVRPKSPAAQLAPKSPAPAQPTNETTRSPSPLPTASSPAPATASSPSPTTSMFGSTNVHDLFTANDAVILPRHLQGVDEDEVQFGFTSKATGPRGPRQPQSKQSAVPAQSAPTPAAAAPAAAAQPASPALSSHSQSGLGGLSMSSPAGRFPGSTSPLIHGLGSSALDSKPIARSGVVGQAPATPQNATLQPSLASPLTQTPQTSAIAAAESPANIHSHGGDEYQSLQSQQDMHSHGHADYSPQDGSHADDVNALAANLAHLNTQSQVSPTSYDSGNDMSGNVGGYHSHSSYLGMDNIASPPNAGLYDPSLGYAHQYEQGGFSDYNSMGYGGYDQFGANMGFQQRGMGPNNKGRGFQPQSQRPLGQQPYQNQYRPQQQSYQNQINKQQQGGGVNQQQKKYQQPGPAGLQQQQQSQGNQQAQQQGGQQGNQSVGQRGPQGGMNGGQSKSPQPTGAVNANPQSQSPTPQPSMMDPYARVGGPSQYNNKPVGQYGQPMQPHQSQGQYGAPKQAPHSPQSYAKSSSGYGGPKGQYQKQGQQQQGHQPYPYQSSLPPTGYASYSPLQYPYYTPAPYPYPAAQYGVNVPAGPPGFNAGRGAPYAPGPSAFGGAPSPFHASGYSSPQGFDEYSNINDGYNKPHYQQHQQGDQSADQSIPVQSATSNETPAWQQSVPAAAPKKPVGPESDPAAQRIGGAYQNLGSFPHQPHHPAPAPSQYNAPAHHFNGPSQPQHVPYSSMHQQHYDAQRHQPQQQQQPQQHYQQWQPSM